MKNLWVNRRSDGTIDEEAEDIALGIGSQIGGLATPDANGSPNIKRTFEELDDRIGRETDELFPDPENPTVFEEVKASVKKLKVVQEVVQGFDANVANIRNRIGFGAEDEFKAPIQKQLCILESRVLKLEDSELDSDLVSFIIANRAR